MTTHTFFNAMEDEKKQFPFCEQLCKKNSKKFSQYIENTTVHGVVRVFTGKSKIRRVFWLIVVLMAVAVCFNNIVDRGMHLASKPAATTLSRIRQQNLSFPAVTICNLNPVKDSEVYYLSSTDAEFESVLDFLFVNPTACNNTDEYDINYRDILKKARHDVYSLIKYCKFAGKLCNLTEDFEPVLTKLGYCYVFNGQQANVKESLGTGVRHGLYLELDIEQNEYLQNRFELDAGVKIAIHGQDEPAEPDESGLAVSPGNHAFISIKKKIVQDKSSSHMSGCREDSQQFKFLQQFNYSTTACLIDCFHTRIAETCHCIDSYIEYPPPSSQFNVTRNCSIADICCIGDFYEEPQVCDCPAACDHNTYETQISYASFPAVGAVDDLIYFYKLNISKTDFTRDFMSVNIYYETFNVEMETTEDSYTVIAFLSDVGGQLGLFIGASIISILEFVTWVLDEFKDRCIGVNDRKIKKWSEELSSKIDRDKESSKEAKPEDPESDQV